MAFNCNYNAIGDQFINFYYENFDKSRSTNLGMLYDEVHSYFNFETISCNGREKILEATAVIDLILLFFIIYFIFRD